MPQIRETIGNLCEQQKVWVSCCGCNRMNWLDKTKVPQDLATHQITGYLFGRCCAGSSVEISIIWDMGAPDFKRSWISSFAKL